MPALSALWVLLFIIFGLRVMNPKAGNLVVRTRPLEPAQGDSNPCIKAVRQRSWHANPPGIEPSAF